MDNTRTMLRYIVVMLSPGFHKEYKATVYADENYSYGTGINRTKVLRIEFFESWIYNAKYWSVYCSACPIQSIRSLKSLLVIASQRLGDSTFVKLECFTGSFVVRPLKTILFTYYPLAIYIICLGEGENGASVSADIAYHERTVCFPWFYISCSFIRST